MASLVLWVKNQVYLILEKREKTSNFNAFIGF